MLSVTVEQFRMIYCDAATRRRRPIVRRTTAADAPPPPSSVSQWWQLSDYPLLLMLIFLSRPRMRHVDTAEQALHCLFESPSLIRNTLRHVMIYQ